LGPSKVISVPAEIRSIEAPASWTPARLRRWARIVSPAQTAAFNSAGAQASLPERRSSTVPWTDVTVATGEAQSAARTGRAIPIVQTHTRRSEQPNLCVSRKQSKAGFSYFDAGE
jgi:hypothetical protein